jgi:hypothetical protein
VCLGAALLEQSGFGLVEESEANQAIEFRALRNHAERADEEKKPQVTLDRYRPPLVRFQNTALTTTMWKLLGS